MDKWGTSNLFKIGSNKTANPSQWEPEFIEYQKNASIAALKHEFSQLRNSVIFIASDNDYGLLEPVLPEAGSKWEKTYEKEGIYFWRDRVTGSIFINGYHPQAALSFHKEMLSATMSVINSELT